MKYILLLIFNFIFLITLTAQKNILSGYVEDKATKEKIVNASIFAPFANIGTNTNNYGFFTLSLPTDTATIIVTANGYVVSDFFYKNTEELQTYSLIKLKELDEVVITTKKQTIEQKTQMSQINVPVSIIKNMPRFLGEADVLKTIQMLPGVAQGAEGTSGVLVRGGGPDQNLILLDGTPVYNAQHIFGIFSTFNADAIKNVELYKGGFPARFGGRLSSVIDIVTKDGNMQEWTGEGGIGLLASRLTVEGPIKKDKTSLMISGRRTYLDVLAQPFIKASLEDGEDVKFGAYFYDLNAKLNHIISKKDRLYFSFFSGQDFFKVKTKFTENNNIDKSSIRLGFGNALATMRWNHVFNKRLFANTLVNFTQYRFVTDVGISEKSPTSSYSVASKYFSSIKDFGGRIDFDYRPNAKNNIKFGGQILHHTFTPGAATIKVVTDNIPEIDTAFNKINGKSFETNIYAEDDMLVTKNLKINAGVHISAFKAKTNWYASVQPRLAARYLLPNKWSVKAAYTHMNQFIHLLTNNTTTLPTDLWVPSTDKIKPMLSKQFAIGIAKSLWNDKVEFTIEAYTKTMDGIIEYQDGASYLTDDSKEWDTKVEQGSGRSKGIEILLQKKQGKTTGWIGYTLSKTDRIFNAINNGNRFPYKYDRRHDFEITLVQKLSERWNFSANWMYSTAPPFTIETASYYSSSGYFSPYSGFFNTFNNVNYYGGRNSFRLLDNHRMDVGFTYTKKKKRHTKSWNFSVYNVYNRQNPFYYFQDNEIDTVTQTSKTVLKGISILPFIPSISYSFQF